MKRAEPEPCGTQQVDASDSSNEQLATTDYLHRGRRRTGSIGAPQVGPSDPEIDVCTAWAPLLQPTATAALRPESDPAAVAYAAGSRLLTVAGIFSPDECTRLIDAADGIGFGRTNYAKAYRGNLRLMTVDASLARIAWERVRHLLPTTLEHDGATWRAVGLNECWRLAKYLKSDRFGAHCDAWFERSADEVSMYTVNVYMNDVRAQDGGATRFFRARQPALGGGSEPPVVSVQPEAGLGVIFRQPPVEELLHDGEELRGGLKYLFRSDVMYRRVREDG